MPTFCSVWKEAVRRGLPAEGLLLVADLPTQRLTLLEAGRAGPSWAISSSRFGEGCAEGSRKTPPGFHRIAERIGAGEPADRVFESRAPLADLHPLDGPPGDRDLILGRILWLDGLEEGVNRGPGVDSHERYIYIHGTNHVGRLGQPASQGCLRMRPDEVVALFDRIAGRETWCWIGRLAVEGEGS